MGYRRKRSKSRWLVFFVLGAFFSVFLFREKLFFWMSQQEPAASSSDTIGQEAGETGELRAPTVADPLVVQPLVLADLAESAALVEELPVDLPTQMTLEVPFTSQAPYGNWDLPYQEACEETAALIAHYFYEKKNFDAATADREILAVVDFQEEHYGFYKDTTAEETARFMRDLWGYKVRVEEPTVGAIKQEIAAGRPVIIPAAGRKLGNPFFSGEGPLYHMLVITGYTDDGRFITNDPGTRRGEDYIYDEDVLLAAIHDWMGEMWTMVKS